jgi:hypothetical protein
MIVMCSLFVLFVILSHFFPETCEHWVPCLSTPQRAGRGRA